MPMAVTAMTRALSSPGSRFRRPHTSKPLITVYCVLDLVARFPQEIRKRVNRIEVVFDNQPPQFLDIPEAVVLLR